MNLPSTKIAPAVNNFTLRHPGLSDSLVCMNLTQDCQVDLKVRFALVVLECPDLYVPKPDGKRLSDIVDRAKELQEPSEATKEIQQNVWLIPLHIDMLFLAHLLGEASRANMPLHILFCMNGQIG